MTSASIRVMSAKMASVSTGGGPLSQKGKRGNASRGRGQRGDGKGRRNGPADDVLGGTRGNADQRGVDPPADSVVGGGHEQPGPVDLGDLETVGPPDQARAQGLGDRLLGGPEPGESHEAGAGA